MHVKSTYKKLKFKYAISAEEIIEESMLFKKFTVDSFLISYTNIYMAFLCVNFSGNLLEVSEFGFEVIPNINYIISLNLLCTKIIDYDTIVMHTLFYLSIILFLHNFRTIFIAICRYIKNNLIGATK